MTCAQRLRSLGLGALVDRGVDAGDWICEQVGFFPLHATACGVTVRGRLRHRSFLAGPKEDGDQYETPIVRTLATRLPIGWVFVDAGAHIGYHSIAASRLVGDTGRVMAFEPDPYNFDALAYNVRGLKNVELHAEALGPASGVATFRRSRGTISSSFLPRKGIGVTDTFDVPVISIDEVVDGHPRVFVKLDVEGFEIQALEGMRVTAEKADELIVMAESNQTALAVAKKTPVDLVESLESLGLTVYEVRADDQLVPAREASLWKCDLIGVRT